MGSKPTGILKVCPELDPFRSGGAATAVRRTFRGIATQGGLTIALRPIKQNPQIAGVIIDGFSYSNALMEDLPTVPGSAAEVPDFSILEKIAPQAPVDPSLVYDPSQNPKLKPEFKSPNEAFINSAGAPTFPTSASSASPSGTASLSAGTGPVTSAISAGAPAPIAATALGSTPSLGAAPTLGTAPAVGSTPSTPNTNALPQGSPLDLTAINGNQQPAGLPVTQQPPAAVQMQPNQYGATAAAPPGGANGNSGFDTLSALSVRPSYYRRKLASFEEEKGNSDPDALAQIVRMNSQNANDQTAASTAEYPPQNQEDTGVQGQIAALHGAINSQGQVLPSTPSTVGSNAETQPPYPSKADYTVSQEAQPNVAPPPGSTHSELQQNAASSGTASPASIESNQGPYPAQPGVIQNAVRPGTTSAAEDSSAVMNRADLTSQIPPNGAQSMEMPPSQMNLANQASNSSPSTPEGLSTEPKQQNQYSSEGASSIVTLTAPSNPAVGYPFKSTSSTTSASTLPTDASNSNLSGAVEQLSSPSTVGHVPMSQSPSLNVANADLGATSTGNGAQFGQNMEAPTTSGNGSPVLNHGVGDAGNGVANSVGGGGANSPFEQSPMGNTGAPAFNTHLQPNTGSHGFGTNGPFQASHVERMSTDGRGINRERDNQASLQGLQNIPGLPPLPGMPGAEGTGEGDNSGTLTHRGPGVRNGMGQLEGMCLDNSTHCSCGMVQTPLGAEEECLFVVNDQSDPMICEKRPCSGRMVCACAAGANSLCRKSSTNKILVGRNVHRHDATEEPSTVPCVRENIEEGVALLEPIM